MAPVLLRVCAIIAIASAATPKPAGFIGCKYWPYPTIESDMLTFGECGKRATEKGFRYFGLNWGNQPGTLNHGHCQMNAALPSGLSGSACQAQTDPDGHFMGSAQNMAWYDTTLAILQSYVKLTEGQCERVVEYLEDPTMGWCEPWNNAGDLCRPPSAAALSGTCNGVDNSRYYLPAECDRTCASSLCDSDSNCVGYTYDSTTRKYKLKSSITHVRASSSYKCFRKLTTGIPGGLRVSKDECLAAAKTVGASLQKTELDGGADGGLNGRPQGCTLHRWGNVEWWGPSNEASCGSLNYDCVCKKMDVRFIGCATWPYPTTEGFLTFDECQLLAHERGSAYFGLNWGMSQVHNRGRCQIQATLPMNFGKCQGQTDDEGHYLGSEQNMAWYHLNSARRLHAVGNVLV